MTQHETELHASLALVVQKAERLADAICQLESAECGYKADHDLPLGSVKMMEHIEAMFAARARIKHDRTVLWAALREAKDTLYHNQQAAA